MRALNEGDVGITTLVRPADPALPRRRGGRAHRDRRRRDLRPDPGRAGLAFLHAAARSSAALRSATWATVGGNLFAPSPYGDLAVALLALDATASVQSGFGAATCPSRNFSPPASACAAPWCSPRRLPRAREPGSLPLPQDRARQAEGRLGHLDRGPAAEQRRPRRRRAHRLRRHGADAIRAKRRRTRAGGTRPRRRRPSPPPPPRRRGHGARRRCARERLVPARDRRRAPAPLLLGGEA